jgi:hypothetical protein
MQKLQVRSMRVKKFQNRFYKRDTFVLPSINHKWSFISDCTYQNLSPKKFKKLSKKMQILIMFVKRRIKNKILHLLKFRVQKDPKKCSKNKKRKH